MVLDQLFYPVPKTLKMSSPTAKQTQTSENPTSILSSPQITTSSHHDQPNMQITTEKLNASNCLEWSQLVTMFMKRKRKMGHLDGTEKAPDVSDPKYKKWEEENFITVSWLVNSMQPEIGRTYLYHKTAKSIWNAV